MFILLSILEMNLEEIETRQSKIISQPRDKSQNRTPLCSSFPLMNLKLLVDFVGGNKEKDLFMDLFKAKVNHLWIGFSFLILSCALFI